MAMFLGIGGMVDAWKDITPAGILYKVIENRVESGSWNVVHSVASINVVKDFGAPLEKAGLLGKTPNVIPASSPVKDGPSRRVTIGAHRVTGIIGKMLEGFAQVNKPLESTISKDSPPDPTYHWAVCVGDFYHELSAQGNMNVVYNNNRLADQKDWQCWEPEMLVGTTKYNDEGIRQAAEEVIKAMTPLYNVYDNNCQLFVLNLCDLICDGAHKKPKTSWQMLGELESAPAKAAHGIMVTNTPIGTVVRI